jgi:hypothetical protein
MKPKHAYAGLAVLGTILPLWQFIPFLRDHGPAVGVFFQQLFSTPVSGFFAMDVIVSSVVLWVLVYVEGRRAGVRHLWMPVAGSLAVGVSLGLPLFLYMRERRLEGPRNAGPPGSVRG